MAAHVLQATGADVLTAGDVGRGRGVEQRERSSGGVLGDQRVRDLHPPQPEARTGLLGAAPLEVGRGVAGVTDHAGDVVDARLAEATVELVAEQDVRELALPVGRPLVVGILALEVLEVDLAVLVEPAALGDDARLALGLAEVAQQRGREREVTQMVHPELRLEAVDRLAPGDRHHAGVVAEHVEFVVGVRERRGERPHRREVRQVEFDHREAGVGCFLADPFARLGAPLHAPTREHDVGPVERELAGGLVAEPAVRPRDDDRLPAQIPHLVRGPVAGGHGRDSGWKTESGWRSIR